MDRRRSSDEESPYTLEGRTPPRQMSPSSPGTPPYQTQRSLPHGNSDSGLIQSHITSPHESADSYAAALGRNLGSYAVELSRSPGSPSVEMLSHEYPPRSNSPATSPASLHLQSELPSAIIGGEVGGDWSDPKWKSGKTNLEEEIKQKKHLRGLQSAALRGVFLGGKPLMQCTKEFDKMEENYLRGCKWSPDGQIVLTNSNDNYMRVFFLPHDVLQEQIPSDRELQSLHQVGLSELVYDYCFYPGWRTEDDDTCFFAVACRDLPVHLYSAIHGTMLGTYCSYDHAEELVAPHSIGFSRDGKYLLTGFRRAIRCFYTERPSQKPIYVQTVEKHKDAGGKMQLMGQKGIVSCFATSPDSNGIVAAGSFSGEVGLYDVSQSCSMITLFNMEGSKPSQSLRGGITHMVFSKDGRYLFTGGRKDPEIICYDLRNPENVASVMYRQVATNQRMYFDLDSTNRYLLSGNHNGNVTVWNLTSPPTFEGDIPVRSPSLCFEAHADACNGCSVNPVYPLLATSSGQRHFDIDIMMEDADSQSMDSFPEENALKVWHLKLP